MREGESGSYFGEAAAARPRCTAGNRCGPGIASKGPRSSKASIRPILYRRAGRSPSTDMATRRSRRSRSALCCKRIAAGNRGEMMAPETPNRVRVTEYLDLDIDREQWMCNRCDHV